MNKRGFIYALSYFLLDIDVFERYTYPPCLEDRFYDVVDSDIVDIEAYDTFLDSDEEKDFKNIYEQLLDSKNYL